MELPDILAGAVGSGVDPNAMLRQLGKARPPPSVLTSLGVPDKFNDALSQTTIANIGPGMIRAITGGMDLVNREQPLDTPSAAGKAFDLASIFAGTGAATAPLREAGLGAIGGKLSRYSRNVPPPKTASLPDAATLRRPELDWHARIADLDARNAPDEAYRNILSAGSKEMRANGAPRDAPSWRDKIIGFLHKAASREGQ